MANSDVSCGAGTAADPIEQLSWHYENPESEALLAAKAGIPVVGITSNTISWELIHAAGAFPFVINFGKADHPDLGNFMEDGIFEQRIRAIFGAALAGDLHYLSLLLIPRTSEQEYKLFLYLKEVVRQDPERRIPPLYLYDMLHAHSPEAYSYGLQRTRQLKERLEEMTGKSIDNAALLAAIKQSNYARRAIRKLLSLRRSEPRLTGTEALALIGAWFFMRKDEYAILAEKAAVVIENRDPLVGKRLMVTGCPLNHRGLHQALEQHGAIVVTEDDWWGSRSAGDDIDEGSGDPVKALFEKYYFDTPSPRLFPGEVADSWFRRAVSDGIDGVVFYLPPEDRVAGWDYPKRRRYLDDYGVPHFVVCEDAGSISDRCHESIERFVTGIRARK